MRVGEVGKLAAVLTGNSPLRRSPLWQREAIDLTEVDLMAFVRHSRDSGESYEAQNNVDVLIAETIKEMARGNLGKPSYLGYAPRDPIFTSGELTAMMSTLTTARSRALLFGLETELSAKAIMELTWPKLALMYKPPLARAICMGLPRHIKLPYVFWEYLPNGAAAPLFGLEDSFLEASYGLGYDRLVSLYRDITWVDDDAEVEDFWHRFATQ